MGAGRFVCVAIPFGLTLASLVSILIVMLAGVTNKNLSMFEIKTQNLSISSSSLSNFIDLAKRDHPLNALTTAGLGLNPEDQNTTASELGLADSYKVSLWNYCSTTGDNHHCTNAKFNWAAETLNTTVIEEPNSSLSGKTIHLPSELRGALKTFKVVLKWTEVVYIIAFFACVAELFLGMFGFCSRAGSCLTFIISGIATSTVILASIMATVSSSIVVAAIKTSARSYNVKGSINTSFLATTWLAVAFSIGAGIFWAATICCCASDHHSSKKQSRGDQEKLIPSGSYQRVDDPMHHNNGFAGQQHGVYNNQQQSQEYGVPLHNVKPVARGGNGAYEPYTHTNI